MLCQRVCLALKGNSRLVPYFWNKNIIIVNIIENFYVFTKHLGFIVMNQLLETFRNQLEHPSNEASLVTDRDFGCDQLMELFKHNDCFLSI